MIEQCRNSDSGIAGKELGFMVTHKYCNGSKVWGYMLQAFLLSFAKWFLLLMAVGKIEKCGLPFYWSLKSHQNTYLQYTDILLNYILSSVKLLLLSHQQNSLLLVSQKRFKFSVMRKYFNLRSSDFNASHPIAYYKILKKIPTFISNIYYSINKLRCFISNLISHFFHFHWVFVVLTVLHIQLKKKSPEDYSIDVHRSASVTLTNHRA